MSEEQKAQQVAQLAQLAQAQAQLAQSIKMNATINYFNKNADYELAIRSLWTRLIKDKTLCEADWERFVEANIAVGRGDKYVSLEHSRAYRHLLRMEQAKRGSAKARNLFTTQYQETETYRQELQRRVVAEKQFRAKQVPKIQTKFLCTKQVPKRQKKFLCTKHVPEQVSTTRNKIPKRKHSVLTAEEIAQLSNISGILSTYGPVRS